MRQTALRTWLKIAISAALVGCGGGSTGADAVNGPGSGPIAPDKTDGGTDSGSASAADAGGTPMPKVDAGAPGPVGPDGPPMRNACTTAFGNALSSTFGRLDGYLVAIVPPGHHGCSGDADHLHLQVQSAGAVYDVAVTMVSSMSSAMPDVFLAEKDAPLGNGPWTEGWHSGSEHFDYVSNLGLHAADFTATPAAALATKIEQRLANVNHISVYATGYGPTGGHKVHRNNGGSDGALVLDPTSPTPHVLAFHFSTQSF